MSGEYLYYYDDENILYVEASWFYDCVSLSCIPLVFPRVPGECFFLISFGSIYLSKCFIRSVRYLRNFFSDLIGISDNLTIPFHSLTTSFSELALSSFAYSKLNWLFPWPLGHIVTLWLLSPPYLVAVIVYWTPCLFCFVTSFCWRSKSEWKSDF